MSDSIEEQLRKAIEDQERATRELAKAIEDAARRDGGSS